MADNYSGPVKIYGGDGVLLTTGLAALEDDPEMGSWKGVIQVLRGTAVAGKALFVNIEIPNAGMGRAQLTPMGDMADRSTSAVTGLGAPPYRELVLD